MKKIAGGRKRVTLATVLALFCCCVVRAQYQLQAGGGFEEDEYFRNLQNTGKGEGGVAKLDDKFGEVGERGRKWVPLVVGAMGGFAMDYIWSGWTIRKIKRQHKATMKAYQDSWAAESIEVEELLNLQRNVYKEKLVLVENTILQLQRSAVDVGVNVNVTQAELDYEDFKQPDANNDDIITEEEFNDYIELYLKAYPTVKKEELPKFTDFDRNGDGSVTFAEWQKYLDNERSYDAQSAGTKDTIKKNYGEASKGENFGDMYEGAKKKKKGRKTPA